MERLIEKVWELITIYGIKVITALFIFIVGKWIAKGLEKLVRQIMGSRNVDVTLTTFVANLTYIAALTFVVIAALGQLGIQTTSFVAILGAAGVAIGLALQGSLSNFASGFLMIIFRPFSVGDFIEGGGTSGVVEKIEIFTTQLVTADNKTVIIPNSKLTGANIVNWTAKKTRLMPITVGIAPNDDIDKVKQVLAELLAEDSRILKEPAPGIGVASLDGGVKLGIGVWVKVEDYNAVYADTLEKIKKRFDKEGFAIPVPQKVMLINN